MSSYNGTWIKQFDPRPKKSAHKCKVPHDSHVAATSGIGSQWVCFICYRIWIVKRSFWRGGIGLVKTKEFYAEKKEDVQEM